MVSKAVKKKIPNRIGRPCSICAHPQVTKINRMIVDQCSFQAVSFSIVGTPSIRESIRRHTENCLRKNIGAVLEAKKEKQGIDIYNELEEQLMFAKSLRVAAQEYLLDPLDPLKIRLIPFAHEIDVTYFDNTDTLPSASGDPVPKKKTAKLGALLADVEQVRNLQVDKVQIKHVDLRQFANDCIKTCDMVIDKFAKISGIYQADKANEETFKRSVEAVKEFLEKYPDADREYVINELAIKRGVSREKISDSLGIIG